MPELLFKTSSLHPDDWMGILEAETQITGIVNNYPIRRFLMPFETLNLYAGNDHAFRIYVKTPELNIVNLTGAKGVLTVKTSKDETVATLTKTTDTASQGEIGSADEGEMFFYLVPADTSALDIRQYVFDVKVTLASGKAYTVLEGLINLEKAVG